MTTKNHNETAAQGQNVRYLGKHVEHAEKEQAKQIAYGRERAKALAAAAPEAKENDSNSTYCEDCGCRITAGRCKHGITQPAPAPEASRKWPESEYDYEKACGMAVDYHTKLPAAAPEAPHKFVPCSTSNSLNCEVCGESRETHWKKASAAAKSLRVSSSHPMSQAEADYHDEIENPQSDKAAPTASGNYAMYEADRIAKRKAQAAAPEAPREGIEAKCNLCGSEAIVADYNEASRWVTDHGCAKAERDKHEFSAANFGPTTAPLCKHCGLSEQAEPHKLQGHWDASQFDSELDRVEAERDRLRELLRNSLSQFNALRSHRYALQEQVADLLQACNDMAAMLERAEETVPSYVLRLLSQLNDDPMHRAAIARTEGRAQ